MSFLPSSHSKKSAAVLDGASKAVILVGAFLFPFVVSPWTRDSIGFPKQIAWYGLVILGLFLFIARAVLTKELTIRRTILDAPLTAFAAVAGVSAMLSPFPSASFLGFPAVFTAHAGMIFAGIVWFWLLVQELRHERMRRLFLSTLLASSSIASLWFLLSDVVALQPVIRIFGPHPSSSAASAFGIYVAAIAVVSWGLLIIRERAIGSQILPALMGILGVLVIARIGFIIPWIVFSAGAAFVLLVGATLLRDARLPVLSAVFFLFLVGLLCIFAGTPGMLRKNLPLEVALGAQASLGIAREAVLHNAKSFVLGDGPGTFVYDFSLYRTPSFNTAVPYGSIRFFVPYNFFFSLLSEEGVMGTLVFLIILLLLVGSVAAVWMKKKYDEEDGMGRERMEAFAFSAGWIAATVGFGISFPDITFWWLWWSLIALSLTMLSLSLPTLVRERSVSLSVSPQYALVLSFGMILFSTASVLAAVWLGRFFLAEGAFAAAQSSVQPLSAREEYLARALRYRPRFPEYHLEAAKISFEWARVESQKPNPDASAIADHLSRAVSSARMAAERDGNNVIVWDTLAGLYIAARPLAPDANTWAIDAVKRAIDLEPSNPTLQLELGHVYAFAKKTKEAEEAYVESIRLKPDYVPAYLALSDLREENGRADEAIAMYQPIIRLAENNADLLFRLGRLLYNRKRDANDTLQAEQMWLRAVQIDPNHSNTLYSLGILSSRKGDSASAIRYFERVLLLNPDSADVKAKLRALRGQ